MLTYQEVQRLLAYNPFTGDIIWKINKTPRGKVGVIAGCIRNDRYIVIGIGEDVPRAQIGISASNWKLAEGTD